MSKQNSNNKKRRYAEHELPRLYPILANASEPEYKRHVKIPEKYWGSVQRYVEYPNGIFIDKHGTPLPAHNNTTEKKIVLAFDPSALQKNKKSDSYDSLVTKFQIRQKKHHAKDRLAKQNAAKVKTTKTIIPESNNNNVEVKKKENEKEEEEKEEEEEEEDEGDEDYKDEDEDEEEDEDETEEDEEEEDDDDDEEAKKLVPPKKPKQLQVEEEGEGDDDEEEEDEDEDEEEEEEEEDEEEEQEEEEEDEEEEQGEDEEEEDEEDDEEEGVSAFGPPSCFDDEEDEYPDTNGEEPGTFLGIDDGNDD